MSIPYHGNISFTIRRTLADYNLEPVLRVDSKLDNFIKLVKYPLDKLDQSNVVYNITCRQCKRTYIGQTGRLLKTRRNEHLNNTNLNEKYHNVVSKHKLEFNHDFNWDNLQILHKENNYCKRCLAENVFYYLVLIETSSLSHYYVPFNSTQILFIYFKQKFL